MLRLVLPLLLVRWIIAGAAAEISPAPYACASRSDIVGPCVEVRGRLSFWNGAPSARIWPVGTKRMLGVHSDELPPTLEVQMERYEPRHRFDTEVWANFTVCPLTGSRPGRMQFVCIESWRNLSFSHRGQ